MACVIKGCTCKNTFQDKEYGQGLRVHNECAKTGKQTGKMRCTVCGATK